LIPTQTKPGRPSLVITGEAPPRRQAPATSAAARAPESPQPSDLEPTPRIRSCRGSSEPCDSDPRDPSSAYRFAGILNLRRPIQIRWIARVVNLDPFPTIRSGSNGRDARVPLHSVDLIPAARSRSEGPEQEIPVRAVLLLKSPRVFWESTRAPVKFKDNYG
jgi:hypothetical protein